MENYQKLQDDLVKFYQDLLEVQYHDKPKAKATIKLLIESLLADMLLWKIKDQCVDVDNSVGVQLDVVGAWVGVDRYFKGQKFETSKWYAYYDWDNTKEPTSKQGSLQDWNMPTKENAPFLDYDFILSVTNKLNDKNFRFLIKLKIIKNETSLTCKNIDDAIHEAFEQKLYTTWGECMQMTYNYSTELSAIIDLAQDKKCLPIPTGVKVDLREQ